MGTDPDPRFTLANERTFLAWIRTSLGLLAAAVGFQAFGAELVGPTVQTVLVIGMLAGSAALSVFAYARWHKVEGALRTVTHGPSRRIDVASAGGAGRRHPQFGGPRRVRRLGQVSSTAEKGA